MPNPPCVLRSWWILLKAALIVLLASCFCSSLSDTQILRYSDTQILRYSDTQTLAHSLKSQSKSPISHTHSHLTYSLQHRTDLAIMFISVSSALSPFPPTALPLTLPLMTPLNSSSPSLFPSSPPSPPSPRPSRFASRAAPLLSTSTPLVLARAGWALWATPSGPSSPPPSLAPPSRPSPTPPRPSTFHPSLLAPGRLRPNSSDLLRSARRPSSPCLATPRWAACRLTVSHTALNG